MYSILHGDAMDVLKTFPSKCVNTIVTSPPYYGLRDYGTEDQIGLEDTPEEYISRLVGIFRECKRVLEDDGVLWVNIGDSYSGSGKGPAGNLCKDYDQQNMDKIGKGGKVPKGTKPKDLIGIPWMLAFALRSDGWYLRQDVIWAKNNPMPESVKDRCTRSHEYVFMLTKRRKYYFDHKAIQEPTVTHNGYETRNKRDVWNTSIAMCKDAHFAVFPEDLVLPCILSSCPENGVVLDPFSGSGTTGVVALKNSRHFVGIEIQKEYIRIAEDRLNVIPFANTKYEEKEE